MRSHYILDEILMDKNAGTSIQSILVSDTAVLGAQDLVFVPFLDPPESLAPCSPSAAGGGPVALHCC